MKAMKFRVENEQHSKDIQTKLFEAGYGWRWSGVFHTHLDEKFLFANIDGRLTVGSREETFEVDINPEYKLLDGEFVAVSQHVEKPPIGLRPKRVVVALRRKEILEAMERYAEANKAIPKEWVEELEYLCED